MCSDATAPSCVPRARRCSNFVRTRGARAQIQIQIQNILVTAHTRDPARAPVHGRVRHRLAQQHAVSQVPARPRSVTAASHAPARPRHCTLENRARPRLVLETDAVTDLHAATHGRVTSRRSVRSTLVSTETHQKVPPGSETMSRMVVISEHTSTTTRAIEERRVGGGINHTRPRTSSPRRTPISSATRAEMDIAATRRGCTRARTGGHVNRAAHLRSKLRNKHRNTRVSTRPIPESRIIPNHGNLHVLAHQHDEAANVRAPACTR